MKTAISVFVSLAFITAAAYLPAESAEPPEMVEFTLPFKGDQAPIIKAAFANLYPIPTIEDPENPEQQIPKFTPNEWVRHKVKEYIKTTVVRSNAMTDAAAKAAEPQITIETLFLDD